MDGDGRRQMETDRYRQRRMERDGVRRRWTDRDRQMRTETDRDGQRQTEIGWRQTETDGDGWKRMETDPTILTTLSQVRAPPPQLPWQVRAHCWPPPQHLVRLQHVPPPSNRCMRCLGRLVNLVSSYRIFVHCVYSLNQALLPPPAPLRRRATRWRILLYIMHGARLHAPTQAA